MSQPTTKIYPAEFKERAVKLAVESDQPLAQTARDLGVNENTLHTWIGKYHRAERQEQQVQDEHLYEELKRLRKEEGVAKVLIRSHRTRPNSYRLMNNPMTRSCMCSVLEKQMVRRTSRLIRVRRLMWLLSIFCVLSLPTRCFSASMCRS